MTEKRKSNGHQEKYNSEVEYEYLDADVWAKRESESEDRTVAYTEDVLEDLKEDDESSESQNGD